MSQESAENHANKPWKRLLHGLGGAAAGAYGLASLHTSMDALLGKRTVYHGTSKRNWERIQHEGLKASHGGSGGAGAAAGHAGGMKRSRGFVHVTPFRNVGTLYTHIATDPDVARHAATHKIPFAERQRLERQPHRDGKLVKIRMDYNKYHLAQQDPDMLLGLRTTQTILPEEIVGSRAKFTRRLRHTARQWPNYVRTHPRQFGTGVLALGVGAGSLALGARLLRRALQTRDRSPEQTLRRAALAAKVAAERGSGGLVKLAERKWGGIMHTNPFEAQFHKLAGVAGKLPKAIAKIKDLYRAGPKQNGKAVMPPAMFQKFYPNRPSFDEPTGWLGKLRERMGTNAGQTIYSARKRTDRLKGTLFDQGIPDDIPELRDTITRPFRGRVKKK